MAAIRSLKNRKALGQASLNAELFKAEPKFAAQVLQPLRNIIEQCTEWQRQLYINYVDFEKAFESIH